MMRWVPVLCAVMGGLCRAESPCPSRCPYSVRPIDLDVPPNREQTEDEISEPLA
jgi:hypothetical protein